MELNPNELIIRQLLPFNLKKRKPHFRPKFRMQ